MHNVDVSIHLGVVGLQNICNIFGVHVTLGSRRVRSAQMQHVACVWCQLQSKQTIEHVYHLFFRN